MSKIRIFPQQELLDTWEELNRSHYRDGDADHPPLCLRCGAVMHHHLARNALCRYMDLYICEDCGADEAMRAMRGEPLPPVEWLAVKLKETVRVKDDGTWVLTPFCSFTHLWQDTVQPNGQLLPHPRSEVCYSRSYYNGYHWFTSWFQQADEKPAQALVQEIDDFQNTLMALPEYRELDTLRRMCPVWAETTRERTEYNLYSETEHFYIWLRIITRPGDYNLYVHYFNKALAKPNNS